MKSEQKPGGSFHSGINERAAKSQANVAWNLGKDQVKTDLQPPGLPRPPPPSLLGSQWALKCATHAGFERNVFMRHGSEPKQGRFLQVQDTGMRLCHRVSGFGRIVLTPLVWTLLGSSPLPHWASYSQEDKWWWPRSTRCLPYTGTELSTYMDCLLLPMIILWVK